VEAVKTFLQDSEITDTEAGRQETGGLRQGKTHSLENKTISLHYQGKSVTFGLTPHKENRTFLSQS
jgi:hypothetical protein